VVLDPRVIQRHVVRDDVEHQLEPARLQPPTSARQRRGAADCGMRRVAGDREPGAGDILRAQIRQRVLELVAPPGMRARDALAGGPCAPHAEEPDIVEAEPGDAVELGVPDVVERGGPSERPGQRGQQHTRVHLAERRVSR